MLLYMGSTTAHVNVNSKDVILPHTITMWHKFMVCGIRLPSVYVYRKITISEAFQYMVRNAWSVLGSRTYTIL